MKLYCYCSYDGSPVGFQMGVCQWDNAAKGRLNLSKEGVDPFIRACFESGLVRGGFGRIPNRAESEYFLLVKKLNHAKETIQYYINVAITSNNWSDLVRMVNGDSQALAKEIAQGMQPSSENEFGYLLDATGWENITFGNLCDSTPQMRRDVSENGSMYLALSTSNMERLTALADEIALGKNPSWCLAPHEKNVVRYGKKALAGKRMRRALLLAAAVFLLAILMILSKVLPML